MNEIPSNVNGMRCCGSVGRNVTTTHQEVASYVQSSWCQTTTESQCSCLDGDIIDSRVCVESNVVKNNDVGTCRWLHTPLPRCAGGPATGRYGLDLAKTQLGRQRPKRDEK